MQLEDLEVISLQALRVLRKFAKVIRQRGYEVEMKSVQPSVLVILRELGLCKYFAWKDDNDRANHADDGLISNVPSIIRHTFENPKPIGMATL